MTSNMNAKAKRWTDEEIDKFANMMIARADAASIARTLGRTEKAIKNQMSDASLGKTATGTRLQFLLTNKKQAAANAAALKAQPKVKAPVVPGSKPLMHRKAWSAKDNSELIKMFAQGTAPDEMAKHLSRTVYSVLGQLHNSGVLSFDKDKGTYFTKPAAYYKVTSPD